MRASVGLDDDILAIVKRLAQQRRKSIGQVLSELARQALGLKNRPRMRNGVPLLRLKRGARKGSLTLVNRLRDEA